jgi:hypothetical protein
MPKKAKWREDWNEDNRRGEKSSIACMTGATEIRSSSRIVDAGESSNVLGRHRDEAKYNPEEEI